MLFTVNDAPDPLKLRDYRLMLVGARMLIQFILKFNKTLGDWKLLREILRCSMNSPDELSALLFDPEDIRFEWEPKAPNTKKAPRMKSIYLNRRKGPTAADIIPEWKWLVSGGMIEEDNCNDPD